MVGLLEGAYSLPVLRKSYRKNGEIMATTHT
jgi:hypothetical protein